MATKKDFVIKNGLVVTEDIQLGHASDTTIARASAGQITVAGTAVVLAGSASHDGFSDFVADEHIDHSGVSILGGNGLTGGGNITSSRTLAVGAGTGITVNSNDVAVTAAQTGITSLLNASLAVGRDADNQIKFSTDNQMIFRVGAGDGVTFKASGEIEATKFDGALEGNADTATALASSVNINGVAFDGSSDITVTAAGSTLSDTVTVAKGGTGQTSYTNGQLLIGNTTGNTLAKATLTAGSGISVTNGAGSITIAATGGGDVVDDTSPQLGGDLDVNGNKITSASNADVTIEPNGTGDINLYTDKVVVGDASTNFEIQHRTTTNSLLRFQAGGNTQLVSDAAIYINADEAGTSSATGSLIRLNAITTSIGKHNTNATLTTSGTGDLTLSTNTGTNSGTIVIADGANGNISLTPNGTGNVSIGNFTFNADQTVGSGQDNYVLTYDNLAGTIGLEAASGGGVSLSGSTNDQLVTVTGSNAIKGESNLTLSSAGALALTGTMTMTDTASDNTTPVLTVEQNRADNNAMLAKFIANNNEVLHIRNNGRLHWELSTDGGDSEETIMSYNDINGDERNFMMIDQGTIVINNRGPNGDIEIRANTSSAGSGGEVSVANFQDDRVVLTQRTGIGINAPVNLLHVFGDNSTTSQSSGGAASITIEQDGTGDAALNFLLTGVQRWIVGIDNSDSDKFKIQTGSTSLGSDSGFTIDTSGNVGIGTTSPQSTMHISSGTSGDAVLILEADTDNNDETDQPYIVFEQDGGVQHSAIGSFSGQNTDNNALIFSNSVDNSGVQAGMIFKTGTSAGYANATESMRIYPAGETQARKTKVKTVSSNTTLGDDDSGKTIYWTGGTLTLPATAESGQQFVVINNKGSSATPGLGTSNSIQTGWTAHAAMSDETARTYIAVAANKWIYIG